MNGQKVKYNNIIFKEVRQIMNLEKTNNNTMIIKYQNIDNVVEDICSTIESARNYAYQSVNIALVEKNWFIGYRIAEEELKGYTDIGNGKNLKSIGAEFKIIENIQTGEITKENRYLL